MTKKITALVLLLIAVFAFEGCNMGGELAEYKAMAMGEIESHVAEGNYTVEGWGVVRSIVARGKTAVDAAKDKAEVDAAVAAAKIEINGVERKDANLNWTNDNAVYAFVKAGSENDILQDVEGAFAAHSFQKVYATEKNINTWTPLALLFILDEDDAANQQEFIGFLEQDARINHAGRCRDLPFATVDTRYIDKAKDTIAVGETLTLEAKGSIDYYVQSFDFKGLLVKPAVNKTYTIADFPVDLKSVEARDSDWLYLELATGGYFEVIKAADVLSRLATIEKVELDRSLLDLPPPPPPTWELSDYTIAEFVAGVQWDDYPKAIIRGLKVGKVTVDFNGVTCEITVI